VCKWFVVDGGGCGLFYYVMKCNIDIIYILYY